jgi:thioesterase domain-containing protein
VQLVARVKKVLGRPLPLAALFEDSDDHADRPTVARLGTLLREGDPETDDPLVPLRRSGEGVPLFLVHPAGGDLVAYHRLVRTLGSRVFGLRPPPGRAQDVESLAATYVDRVRAASPDGPYRLAGWSMGGLVAFEMARLLSESGAEVERLVLVDTYFGALLPSFDETTVLLDFVRHIDVGARLPRVRRSELRGLAPGEDIEVLVRRLTEAGAVPPGVDLADRLDLYRRHARAAREYEPKPWSGAVTLVHASAHPHAMHTRSESEWRSRVDGPVDAEVITGDHFSLMTEPAVSDVARVVEGRP